MSEPVAIPLLVVENDPVSAGLLKGCMLLEKETRFEMTWSPTLSDALTKAREADYEAMIVALNLPDSEEIETFERMRQVAADVPILVLTSNEDIYFARQFMLLGAQEVLIRKRIDSRTLHRTIVFAIERHHYQKIILNTAFKDDLTGLDNRAFFLSSAERELEIARRRGTHHTLILFRELDDKQIEPMLPEGRTIKHLRRQIATVLRSRFRSTDLLARLDEKTYAILALDSDIQGNRQVKKRLAEYTQELQWIVHSGVAVSFPESQVPIGALLDMAESNLHERTQFSIDTLDTKEKRKLALRQLFNGTNTSRFSVDGVKLP